jgi:hypothetical protein
LWVQVEASAAALSAEPPSAFRITVSRSGLPVRPEPMIRAATTMTASRAIHSKTSSAGRDGTSPTGIGRTVCLRSRGANSTPATPTPIRAAITA